MSTDTGQPPEQAPERRRRDTGGMVIAVLSILLGLWVWQQSMAMTAVGAIFPRTVATALIIFAVILIIGDLRRHGRVAPTEEEPPKGAPESTRHRLALIVIMAAWVLLMPVIGFFVSSLLAFLGVLVVANYDPWTPRRAIAYVLSAVVIVGAFYLLLVEVLLVPAPQGILF